MSSILTKGQVRIVLDWAKDLMSGNRLQGKSRLATYNEETGTTKFCCLGVLSDRAVDEGVLNAYRDQDSIAIEYGRGHEDAELPLEVQEWSGLDHSPEFLVPEHLRYKLADTEADRNYYGNGWVSAISLNDEYEFTFSEIGECIINTYGPKDETA